MIPASEKYGLKKFGFSYYNGLLTWTIAYGRIKRLAIFLSQVDWEKYVRMRDCKHVDVCLEQFVRSHLLFFTTLIRKTKRESRRQLTQEKTFLQVRFTLLSR